MTLFEDLKYRGLIKDISSPELEDKLNNEKLTFIYFPQSLKKSIVLIFLVQS